MLLVLKSFVRNRFAVSQKSLAEISLDSTLLGHITKLVYVLYFIKCIVTFSEAIRQILSKMLFATL